MGTFGRIQVRCRNEQIGREALEAARASLDEVDRLLSTYRDDSELSEVNRRAGREPVAVSMETYHLLLKALDYSRKTDGAFDITVGPLLRLWKQAARENRLPSQAELAQAKEKGGYEKVLLGSEENRTVSFAVEGVELNVDAIAKGYAVDRALAALRRPEVTAALVDIGGEIACFGREQSGKDWRVGIQDPFAKGNDNPISQRARWVVSLSNGAVATSGNYRQYLTIGGEKFGKIVDPRTGEPTGKLHSVTIIAAQTVDADALATAVSVMGLEKGLKLIESLENTEALVIAGTPAEPREYRSSGFDKYEIPL
jgi:thiamine biosynthesis lipoprotein